MLPLMQELQAAYPDIDVFDKVIEWKRANPLSEIEDLRKLYLTNRNARGTMSTYTLRVCHTCNHDCIHCFNEEEKKEQANRRLLTTEELCKIIDDVDAKEIIVTGGEPTTRKDLFEILQYIKNKGKRITIQSNGKGFADPEYARKLSPYLDTITLPIHSGDPEIFEAVTQCKGSFEATIRALRNLSDTKVGIITQTVLNQLNYKTIENTYDLIQSINPGVIMTLTFPHPIASAYSTKVTPRFSDIKPYVHKALRKYSYLILTHYLPRCVLYPYQSIVSSILDQNDVAEIPKPGIEFLEGEWKSVNYESTSHYRIKSKVCSECRFDRVCQGVWKEYGALYPNLDLVPIQGEKE